MAESVRSGLLAGFWFYFDVDGHRIAINLSMWTGRERIWVDDEEVVNAVSMRLRTRHEIELDGTALTIEVGYNWSAAMFARISRGEQVLAHEEQGRIVGATLIAAFVLGVITAILVGAMRW